METTRVLYVGHRIFGEISGGEGGGEGVVETRLSWLVSYLYRLNFYMDRMGMFKIVQIEWKSM